MFIRSEGFIAWAGAGTNFATGADFGAGYPDGREDGFINRVSRPGGFFRGAIPVSIVDWLPLFFTQDAYRRLLHVLGLCVKCT